MKALNGDSCYLHLIPDIKRNLLSLYLSSYLFSSTTTFFFTKLNFQSHIPYFTSHQTNSPSIFRPTSLTTTSHSQNAYLNPQPPPKRNPRHDLRTSGPEFQGTIQVPHAPYNRRSPFREGRRLLPGSGHVSLLETDVCPAQRQRLLFRGHEEECHSGHHQARALGLVSFPTPAPSQQLLISFSGSTPHQPTCSGPATHPPPPWLTCARSPLSAWRRIGARFPRGASSASSRSTCCCSRAWRR